MRAARDRQWPDLHLAPSGDVWRAGQPEASGAAGICRGGAGHWGRRDFRTGSRTISDGRRFLRRSLQDEQVPGASYEVVNCL